MKILIATSNKHKIREINDIMQDVFKDIPLELVSLKDIGFTGDIIEDGNTFEENALIKAKAGAAFSGLITIADDSGLSVEALGGAPGIYSARYADDEGYDHSDSANNAKLIRNLQGIEDRRASYVCAMACAFPDERPAVVARGTVDGLIVDEPKGNNGFGYDPYFYYPPFGCRFAEASEAEKNSVSHRKNATAKLCEEIKNKKLF